MIGSADIERAAAFMTARIGTPYEDGAKGPGAYDCGGLLSETQWELFGREIAIGNVDPKDLRAVVEFAANHPLKLAWTQHQTPLHGDVMLLSGSRRDHHVGTYLALDRGGLFHCVEDGGVRFDRINTLAPLGWRNVSYWRPAA